MSTQEKSAKSKKSDLAFSIFAKHLPTRDKMKKREWRAMVIKDMSETLGVTNMGTLGGYFSWSDQVITGRPCKVYSRGDGARAKKGSRVDENTQAELTRLSNAFAGAGAKRAAKKAENTTEDTGEFKPKGFGVASF